jgi:hypothetical protein
MSQTKSWRGARPKGLARITSSRYQQASWTRDDLTFEQHLPSRTCTCEAGEKGHWCKHLTAAFLAAFVDNCTTAREMEPQLRRKLLKLGTHAERPYIELALCVAEWEKQRDQPAPPQPSPSPEGEALPSTRYEDDCAYIDTTLAKAGRAADREWTPRRPAAARLPEGNRAAGTTRPIIAGYQAESAALVAVIAAEEGQVAA